MLKKDKIVICGAPGCGNLEDRNSNKITLVNNKNNVIITKGSPVLF